MPLNLAPSSARNGVKFWICGILGGLPGKKQKSQFITSFKIFRTKTQ